MVFTDEWGGGTAARCRAADQLNWGANAVYDIVGGKLQFRSYVKIPPVQTAQENCVSHLPSLVPVPGRDIMVQAWYQGGASLIDFTDSCEPEGDRLLGPRPDQRDGARRSAASGRTTGTTARSTAPRSPAASTCSA